MLYQNSTNQKNKPFKKYLNNAYLKNGLIFVENGNIILRFDFKMSMTLIWIAMYQNRNYIFLYAEGLGEIRSMPTFFACLSISYIAL